MKLKFDSFLVLAMIGLLIMGLVMVTSASMPVAIVDYHNSFYFIIRQTIFMVIGIIAMVVMLKVPTSYWQQLGPLWLVIGLALLVLVLIPGIGHVINGSRRWIIVGPIAVQVSELVKLCAVMYVSGYLVRHNEEARFSLEGILKPVIALGAMGGLMLLEPDFGATVVMFVTALGLFFMAGVRLRWFYLLLIALACAAALLILFSPYRLARFLGFLHPWDNQLSTGYQLSQSLIAFGRGGFLGVGLGNSIQKLFYLPEAYTDFILAIIAEELGVLGVLLVILLFAILIWRGLAIAKRAHLQLHLFEALVAYGITFWLAMQVIVNMGVNVGLFPTKGLTLPFISYGGSSLVVDCMVIGILLRIDLQNQQREQQDVMDTMKSRQFSL